MWILKLAINTPSKFFFYIFKCINGFICPKMRFESACFKLEQSMIEQQQ